MASPRSLALLLCTLLTGPLATKSTVFFSPDDDPRVHLLQLIDDAQQSIKVAVYTFTETQLANALVRAHKRGVAVDVVLDDYSNNQWGKIHVLEKGGIPVHIYNPKATSKEKYTGIMHDKFAIFDNATVWTGSYNWTYSANFRNQENALVIENETDVTMRFAQQFDILKERCAACGTHKGIPAMPKESISSSLAIAWRWLMGAAN